MYDLIWLGWLFSIRNLRSHQHGYLRGHLRVMWLQVFLIHGTIAALLTLYSAHHACDDLRIPVRPKLLFILIADLSLPHLLAPFA